MLTTPGCGPGTRTITDPDHLLAAKLLRRGRADLVRPLGQATDVQTRDLAIYDAVFGVDGGVA